MVKITTGYRIICDFCKKDITNEEMITLDCNDTGLSDDYYECHYCNKMCAMNEEKLMKKTYTLQELEQISLYAHLRELKKIHKNK